VSHQPAISFSISFQHPFNRAGGRTFNVLQENPSIMRPKILTAILLLSPPSVPILSAAENQGQEARFANKSRLGIPLKTQATVEAEVVRAEDVGRKDLAGQYLLRVIKVDGIELQPKQVFSFTTGAGVPKLPIDAFELYKEKTGRTVDDLPQEEIRLAEQNFIGRKLTYLASEVAGPPKNGSKPSESRLLLSQLLDTP